VSRGELIEIGGSFRLPEIMAASGAKLREVGTTNKLAFLIMLPPSMIRTGALLKVHPSNYQLSGFTQSVSVAELVALGRSHDLSVIHDIGSGALFDLDQFGCSDEPVGAQFDRSRRKFGLIQRRQIAGGTAGWSDRWIGPACRAYRTKPT